MDNQKLNKEAMEKVVGGQNQEGDQSNPVLPIGQTYSPRECPTCGTVNYIPVNTLSYKPNKCTNCGGTIL